MTAKTHNVDSGKMSFEGASPLIFGLTIVYSLPVIVSTILLWQTFQVRLVSRLALVVLGALLLLAGIPLYLIVLREITSGFKAHRLLTEGAFSLCRNPLFAVVIFLLIPGVLLFFGSWLLLTIPLFMYVMFKIFIRREEVVLEQAFGKAYVKYRMAVPAIVPVLGTAFLAQRGHSS